LINGVLCGPDGTPLTPAAAAAIMAVIGGKHGGSIMPSGSSTPSGSGGSSTTPGSSSQAPRATPPQSQSASRSPTGTSSTTSTPVAYGERHPQVSHQVLTGPAALPQPAAGPSFKAFRSAPGRS